MQPTQSLAARVMRKLALTTKNVNKGFYKGTRTGSMGTHTKYGGYRLDWDKVRTYRVPDISEFRLTPFVHRNIKAGSETSTGLPVLDGKMYLKLWKNEGGEPTGYTF